MVKNGAGGIAAIKFIGEGWFDQVGGQIISEGNKGGLQVFLPSVLSRLKQDRQEEEDFCSHSFATKYLGASGIRIKPLLKSYLFPQTSLEYI